MGKLGAAVSTYLMPMALDTIGIKEVLIILAGISIAGAALSLKLKEPAGLSLEEISEEKILLKISN
jgi:PHS family inorganic phosphate transporter-like MFS transporter